MAHPLSAKETRSSQPKSSIRFIGHPTFCDRSAAEALAHWEGSAAAELDYATSYMPDEVTRETAKKMHYAGFRAEGARNGKEAALWRDRYYRLRDRIVLGNRKLVFGAIKRKGIQNRFADDWIGECYIVMIRAVAAFNPWIGIRFSTYACTCLLRALARLQRRSLSDRLAQHLSLDPSFGEEPVGAEENNQDCPGQIEEFLKRDHDLLNDREKMVLLRRFHFGGSRKDSTLERVGQDLGISKERVRQVQASALAKLRQALAACS